MFLSLFLRGAVDNELGALSPTEGRLNRPRAIYIADGLPIGDETRKRAKRFPGTVSRGYVGC